MAPPRQRWRRPSVLRHISTIDLETDRFITDRAPAAFAAGYYDPERGYKYFWGPSCVDQLVTFLLTIPEPRLIYAHNGGNFDYKGFMLRWVMRSDPPPFFIKTRLVKWHLGHHELRDSYAILPAALGTLGDKREIDMTRMDRDQRERHKFEILRYLERDCTLLHELVSAFIEEFGAKLTAASAALSQLKTFHRYGRLSPGQDDLLRPYFHGGHVEGFIPSGVHPGPWRLYDVNSMYAFCMARFDHPMSNRFHYGKRITRRTFFLTLEGVSRGAFGCFDAEGDYHFPVQRGRFQTTIHEYRAAVKLGLLKPGHKIIETVDFDRYGNFAEFIEHFYEQRQLAKAEAKAGNRKGEIFSAVYKIILNGAFGKTGIDPRNFKETCLTPIHVYLGEPWVMVEFSELCRVWECPAEPADYAEERRAYENVAIAASVTGAARAVLMEARARADTPAYTDTDSMLCRDLPADMIDENELGKWKLEAEGDSLALAGKKLYALARAGKLVKYGCKGSALTGGQEWKLAVLEANRNAKLEQAEPYDIIAAVAEGRPVMIPREAPTIARTGEMTWQRRVLKRTLKTGRIFGLPLDDTGNSDWAVPENSLMPEEEE